MPQDPYANELSYERDIVPLQKRYFQSAFRNPNLNPNTAAMLSQQFSEGVAGAYAERQRMAAGDQEMKQRKLQFDTAMFTLDREREKANRERTMLDTLAPFQKQLDSVLSDTTSDTATKQQQIAQLGVKNAGLFALNPAAATAFDAARTGVVNERKKKATMHDYIIAKGDPDLLEGYAKEKGIELDWSTEIPVLDYSKLMGATDMKQRQEAYKIKLALEEEQRYLQGAADIAKNAPSLLKLQKNLGAGEVDPNKWESPSGPAAVASLLNVFGTPQEKEEIPKLTPAEQIKRVSEISSAALTGKRKPNQAQAPKENPYASSFSS